jgi:hypothetical protein
MRLGCRSIPRIAFADIILRGDPAGRTESEIEDEAGRVLFIGRPAEALPK